ncbi:cell polarity protein-like protein [Venturia nashicola]|nr:cell polarity protein-like protein [Venturia nashicola]
MNQDPQSPPPTQLQLASFSNSPTPTTNSDWSYPLASPYGAPPPNGRTPDTPPVSSGHTSGSSTTDGAMQNSLRRPSTNGNPSPPSSISRSSDDNGLYAHSVAGSVDGRRAFMMEESLSEHYRVLKNYLAAYLNSERSDPRQNRARDKLLRLTSVQFQELSTDVYDELLRREDDRRRGGPGAPGNPTPKYLLPKQNFHFKRNQARQKLSTLPPDRFRQLATDVFFELERRYPRFLDPNDRPISLTPSVASMGGRSVSSMGGRGFQPPPRTASHGPGPSEAQRNGYGPGVQPGLDNPPNDYGRPLPKTFQSNIIVPEKGLMVEDDEDEDLTLTRGPPGGDMQMRIQVEQLEQKIDELEHQLREKSSLVEEAQSSAKDRDSTAERERTQWTHLRSSLEAKVQEAQDLNNSLKAEIDRVQSEKQIGERELQDQIENARRSERDLERDLRTQLDTTRKESQDVERDLRTQLAAMAGAAMGSRALSRTNSDAPPEWRERFETLEQELNVQRQTTEEVRRDAAQFLEEMRSLSQQSAETIGKEERLLDQVSALEREIREWKSRYSKVKSQNRSLRASSLGLPGINADVSQFAQESPYTAQDGLIKDFHVTNYQLAIDDVLQGARRPDAAEVLTEGMKQVIVAVRDISMDVESLASSEHIDENGLDFAKEHARVKSKLSSSANNFITATKTHVAGAGLAPVSLIDAAASHLTASVVEVIQLAKVRPSTQEELETGDLDERVVSKPAPLTMRTKNLSIDAGTPLMQGKLNGLPKGHVRNQSSWGSSTGYSAYSRYSRYSNNVSPSRDTVMNGDKGLGISQSMGMNYLEDSTAILVRSIQPLVNTVRSASGNPVDVTDFIRDIDSTVHDIASKTCAAITDLRDAGLAKHAPPIVKSLEASSAELVRLNDEIFAGGKAGDALAPAAFKIARATKELVLRVDRIETGELTVDSDIPEF